MKVTDLLLVLLATATSVTVADHSGHRSWHHHHRSTRRAVFATSSGISSTSKYYTNPYPTLVPTGGLTGPLSSGTAVRPSGVAASSGLGLGVSSASSIVSSPSPSSTPPSGSPNPDFIRGINIGGWLVLEKSFDGRLFESLDSAVDEWTFDSLPGAGDLLESHYENYFNESHVQLLKSYGINALRIPIGFWAYDASGTPYYSQGIGKGADAYLEKAVGWAKDAGMRVWVDAHGLPGSQNGFDNSGHAGSVEWQTDANQAKSITILEQMAEKYGALEYQGTVIGLELVNEPISWGANTFAKNQEFAKTAYAAVKAKAANKEMAVVMHDAFEDPANWTDLALSLGPKGSFVIDHHMYQILTAADQALTQEQHIQTVCERGIPLSSPNQKVPVIVGEWTATTQVCFPADGTTSTPGSSCDTPGCSCITDSPDKWTPHLIDQMRRFVEAQLEIFEAYTSGYFLWTWTDPNTEMGSWDIKTGMEKGFIPNPLNDFSKRMYPGQCDA